MVWLHGDDVVPVRAPRSRCGEPVDAARAAYDALFLQDVSVVRLRQVDSQLAVDSGCPERYKDTLAISEGDGGARATTARPRPLAALTRECTYRVELDADGLRVGRLTAARTLTALQLARVNAALARVGPGGTCSRHGQTRFALLSPPGGPGAVVALDGCAVQEDEGWWRAGDDLRALLS